MDDYLALIKDIKWLLHYGLLGLIAIFLGGDLVRAFIKRYKEIKRECKRDGDHE